MPQRLDRHDFNHSARELAVALLGCRIVHRVGGELRRARIVEVEAYADDAASHSAGRKRTPRNSVMFGAPGMVYIYLSYGVHCCLNVVAEPEGIPSAVLIRGIDEIEPAGPHVPRANQAAPGPGLVCRALGLTLADNRRDLVGDPNLWFEAPDAGERSVVTSRRIGISKAVDLPWRWYLQGSPGVSKRDRAAELAAPRRG